MRNKILLLVLGGLLMIGGDYLVSYFDPLWIFLIGELLALGGWVAFVLALEK